MSEQADQGTSPPVPEFEKYMTKTPLILPFKGVWIVGNGGRTEDLNEHLKAPPEKLADQTYAYDFVGPVRNQGGELSDYEAFGQEVIAPGDGIISQVVDGSFDVQIGESDTNVVTGNMVIIDHRNGEWSVLCHFMHDSIRVKVGQEIRQGEALGQCGNSGNTTGPHIHYQLQDNLLLHRAHGLPAQFRVIKVNRERKENFEPEKGQRVENV